MSSPAIHDISALPLGHDADPNADGHGHAHAHADGQVHPHITPPWLLLGVYLVLVALTVLTVAVTYVELGSVNLWVALAIAVLKAGLVAFYFMHLRWDNPFNGVILVVSLFFVALFIGIAILDSKEYQHNYIPPGTYIRP